MSSPISPPCHCLPCHQRPYPLASASLGSAILLEELDLVVLGLDRAILEEALPHLVPHGAQ
eukprot:131616-Pyramimonas_sp.AAC.1